MLYFSSLYALQNTAAAMVAEDAEENCKNAGSTHAEYVKDGKKFVIYKLNCDVIGIQGIS